MSHTITIRCKNTGRSHKVPAGFNLEQVYDMLELNLPHGPMAAKVNNKVEGLHYTLFGDKDVEFIDVTSASGLRTYTRSLFFILYKAVRDLFPEARIRIDISVSNGYYCRLDVPGGVTAEIVSELRQRMREIVDAKIPYHRITAPTDEVIELFHEHGQEDKARLLRGYGSLYTHYYTLDGLPDYFYGSLLIHTGQIYLFDIMPFDEGLLLRIPDPHNPDQLQPLRQQEKMFEVYREHHRWQDLLGVSTIGEFNEVISKGYSSDLINVGEALQEKKISRLADRIAEHPNIQLILVAGPSSSGKTTFSKRLSIQLMACGLHPIPISIDDYFVDRVKTPLDENGNYDFENITAINLELFNQQMNALLRGDEVELQRYDFPTGRSLKSGRRVRMKQGDLIILEGNHALNPVLTEQIPSEVKFKIYTSALTSILLDYHNYIPTTDNRMLRRIVRDYKYRGYTALETLRRWPSVRKGEEKWIFPYQEEADVIINTSLLFELSALRNEALQLLDQVPEHEPEYSEAYRLKKFLQYLKPVSTRGLPPTSLLREFLGGSTFKY